MASPQHTTTFPKVPFSELRFLTDEELQRWLVFYRRRLALIDVETIGTHDRQPAEEIAALVEAGRDWYALFVREYEREVRQRQLVVERGVPLTQGRYPDALIADMKRRTPLGRFLEDHLGAELSDERRGVQRGPCPIHGGRNPSSFVVYVSDSADQHYRCWSCGAGGDIYSAIIQQYGVEFRGAVEILAAFLEIDLPRPPARPTPAARPSRERGGGIVIRRAAAGGGDADRTA